MDLVYFLADRQNEGSPPVMWVCAPARMFSFSEADGGYGYMDGGGVRNQRWDGREWWGENIWVLAKTQRKRGEENKCQCGKWS